MTLYQVFYRFCKENKLLGKILLSFNAVSPIYAYVFDNGSLNKCEMTFRELVEKYLCYRGVTDIRDTMERIMYEINYTLVFSEKEKEQAIRRWKYFVSHNILVPRKDEVSDGAIVTLCERFGGDEIPRYKINGRGNSYFYKNSFFATNEINQTTTTIPIYSISTLNGDKFEYQIKRKNRIYG